ncbi:calcium-activated chloride channel regulator 1-like isoform X1 [Macrobrachium rosenbergii]|uniref:calcium-activated chloride channel regulator 1-like isoform X1 n=2 Tax=Macrobrachium rosenbergii TaxID=79674 RepID=UPI0034D47B5B
MPRISPNRTMAMPCTNRLRIFRFAWLLVVLLYMGQVIGTDGDLVLRDNGYEGLVISITEQVSQEHCNHIIHGLKSVLRELSSMMWAATNGRASIREVTVSLPRTWKINSLTCSLLIPLLATSSPTDAHILVTSPHPAFGSRPWTQQSQGCGRQGDFIQVGGDLLWTSSNDSYTHAARLLLIEWAKFRWGVFDERGHVNDPLYPPTYRDPNTYQFSATACADGAVKGAACDPVQPGCSFSPDPYTNSHLESSLLAMSELPSVRKFCNDKTHNRVAPTKHNALCGGRSVWEIMQQTEDFIAGRNLAGNGSRGLDPSFKFVQESSPRFVFVIENTATMNLQRRWEFLRKAMRRVVVYDVPSGSRVGVVTFHSTSETQASMTYIEGEDYELRQRVGSALPRNPSLVPESQKCILCGLQEAIRVIGENDQSSAGATVVLITTGSGPTPVQEVSEMMRLAKSHQVKIEVVLYPLSERRGAPAVSHGLEELVEATKGSIFTVMDEGVGNDSKVKMMVALMDAMLATITKSAPPNAAGTSVLVHSDAFPGGISSTSRGTFALDDSLGPNARFSVYYYDLNHVGNTIQLTSPSGEVIASGNVQEEDLNVNMIFVNLEKAERGLWTYSVENRADSHQGLYVQVTAKRNSSTGLQVRLWTSTGSRPVNTSDPSTPVIIYAEVKEGNAPILDARVVARIQRLGSNATGSNYNPIFLDLWDNGIGDPDITKGDGVYSRYLVSLHGYPGRYLLSADVDYNTGLAVVAKGPPTRHHKVPSSHLPHYYQHGSYESSSWGAGAADQSCCGSRVPHAHTRRVAPFHRHVTWGVLEVNSPITRHDNVPPARILDLRVEVNDTIHEITLRWTAPGDDWDFGRAHSYEAVVAPYWREARSFQGDRLTGLPQPLPAGTLHTTNLYFTRYEELWYVSLRAVDEAGNTGGIGNIAALWVPRPPTTYEITTRTQPGLTTSGNYTFPSELGSGKPVGASELAIGDIAVILGSIGGFLIVVAVVVTFCYCQTMKRRKQHQQEMEVEKMNGGGNGGSVMIKSGSLGMEQGNGSHESLDSVVKEAPDGCPIGGRPLSPVQSWGASTLLKEHERRLSIPSGTTEASVVAYPVEGVPLHAPYPDVTVRDYRPEAGTNDNAPVFMPCPHDDAPCHCAAPGPEYKSYAAAWDEPLTGHLLSRARDPVAPTPTSHQAQVAQVDRKRRNVTQV